MDQLFGIENVKSFFFIAFYFLTQIYKKKEILSTHILSYMMFYSKLFLIKMFYEVRRKRNLVKQKR